jgi:hypothetical protein
VQVSIKRCALQQLCGWRVAGNSVLLLLPLEIVRSNATLQSLLQQTPSNQAQPLPSSVALRTCQSSCHKAC